MQPDFIVNDDGTIVTFEPKNDCARNFTIKDLQAPAGKIEVNHSIALKLVFSLQDEGFVLELDQRCL